MRGWSMRVVASLLLLGGTAAAASQLELSVIEWSVPGVPEPVAAVAYHIDGRNIKAGPGETVYVSSPERLTRRAAPQEIQASVPSAPAWRGRDYPRTKVTLNNGAAPEPSAVAADTAYATLGQRGADKPRHFDDGGVRIPRAFTFEPDASPVIIRGVTSPGGGGRAMPVRNANVYRRLGGGRQAAEVIDKEPVEPSRIPDNSVMAPPNGGRLYRAEVVLPSSARGIGMDSEYASGR